MDGLLESDCPRRACALSQASTVNASETASQAPRPGTDSTDPGLDFMRQHYHKFLEEAVAQQRLPSWLNLRRLIVQTANHRTTDDDWQVEEL